MFYFNIIIILLSSKFELFMQNDLIMQMSSDLICQLPMGVQTVIHPQIQLDIVTE